MKKILIAIFLLAGYLVPAQDAKTDFEKINRMYYQSEQLRMDVRYDLFFDNEVKPADSESGVYKRNKNEYYLKQAGNEMLVTGEHLIAVDHSSKVMIVETAKGHVNPANPLKMDLDSLLRFYEKIEFYKTGARQELSAYRFSFKNGLYQSIEVVFDPATFYVKEIISLYREKMPDAANVNRKARLRMSFSGMGTTSVFDNDFKPSHYVTAGKNKLVPAAAYTNYKLLTNLKQL